MKIVQLVTRRQRRGAEVFAAHLSDGLVQRGHQVSFVGLYDPPTPAQILAAEQAENYDLHGVNKKLNLLLLRRLARYLSHVQPDLVQANGSDTLKYGVLAKRLSRGRWPLVYRNISLASHWIRTPVHRWWGRWLLRSVDQVVSVSKRSRDDYAAAYQFPSSRIAAVPRGVPTEPVYETTEARNRLAHLAAATPDQCFLVHVGSFSPEKNHQWMLQAFTEIQSRKPNTHLFLLGDGKLRPAVEAAVRRDGLAEHVHVLGNREDVSALVAGADVLLLPSLVEGIPGVILEAAVQGVPAVANDVGGIHEALKDGETGRLVPVNNEEAFKKAVIGLLENEEERRRLGRNAHAFVKDHHDVEKIIDTFEDIYAHLIEGTPVAVG